VLNVARPSAQFLARRAAIAVFWCAIAFTFACAIMPPERLYLADRDKLEHFIAFFTLTILATAAYPSRALATCAMAMLAFGTLIEVIQALPMVGRDGDLSDLLVDGAAIASASLLLAFTGARFKLLRLLRPTPDFVQSVHGR
jgi:VanZ family protein